MQMEEEYQKEQSLVAKLSKFKKSDIQFYLFFIIIEGGEALNIGQSNTIFLAFALTAMFFLVYKILNTKYRYPELFFIVALGAIGILIYYNTNKAGGILSIMALIGLKGVDLKKLFKICFYLRLFLFFILMCLTSFGVIENIKINNIRGNNTIVRYSMGYSHPNQFHLAYILLLLVCIYLYYEKLNFLHLIFFGILNIFVYTKSFSRTSTLIGFLAIFMMLWFRSPYFQRLKNAFCMSIIPLSFLLSIVPVIFYENIPNLRIIDNMLQWRLTFSKHYLTSYSLKLFGNNLNGDSIVLDNGYVELVINYGLLFTFLYLFSYLIVIKIYIKKKKYQELLLIVCLSIYGITEAFIPNLFANLSMIFLSDTIF